MAYSESYFEGFLSISIARAKRARKIFSRPCPLQLPARVQWRSISMSRHNFTACNSKILSRNLSVQLFICSIVSEKLANRGIVWLSNGKGGGLPGNTEAPPPPPPPTCLISYNLPRYRVENSLDLSLSEKSFPDP